MEILSSAVHVLARSKEEALSSEYISMIMNTYIFRANFRRKSPNHKQRLNAQQQNRYPCPLSYCGALFPLLSMPHRARHSGLPMSAPKLTGGTRDPVSCTLKPSSPNAARTMSFGICQSPVRMLSVPGSSELSALTRKALSQPMLGSIPYLTHNHLISKCEQDR
jgi:hypothetical protein